MSSTIISRPVTPVPRGTTICVVGACGTGKSSFVRLFIELFQQHYDWKACSYSTRRENFTENHFSNWLTIINTPGLEQWDSKPDLPPVDLFVYCARADQDFTTTDAKCLWNFNDYLGSGVWEGQTMVLLSFADNVRPLEMPPMLALEKKVYEYQSCNEHAPKLVVTMDFSNVLSSSAALFSALQLAGGYCY